LPVVSHRFWMPMATALRARHGRFRPLIGDFRAGQLVIVAVAAFLPPAAHAAARTFGAGAGAALVAAIVVGCGGLFAPAWVSADGFAPAALLGTLFFLAFARAAGGAVRAGAAAGALLGLVYLTRAEGALFGLPLLWLAARPISRPRSRSCPTSTCATPAAAASSSTSAARARARSACWSTA
jgi:hypothetical protein